MMVFPLVRSPNRKLAANTVFLLSCDGTNASTSFPDDANTHTFTANGNAQVTTAQKKFGTGSLLLDGTGDFLSTPDNASWAFSSATIEMFIRLDVITGRPEIVGQRNTGDNGWGLYLDFGGSGGLRFIQRQSGSSTVDISQGSNSGWAINTWYHVAMVKDGNDYELSRDGTVVASGTDTTAIADFSGQLEIGGDVLAAGPSSNNFDGHMDEIRFSSVARYSGSFTPPTQPFPDG